MVKISMDTFVKRLQPDRYHLWLQGKDVGAHPEDPSRQYAAPPPTQRDVLVNKNNPVLPQSFLEAPKKNPKRHPIHKKKGSGTSAGDGLLPSIDRTDEEELVEIPPDVQKVLEEMALEEEEPDEDTLEVLEDIWLKAGEMDLNEATVYSEMRKKQARKRKRQSNSDGLEQNKPRKKRPKVEVISTSTNSMVLYPETQMSGIPDSTTDISRVIKKVRIKQVKKVKLQGGEDKLQTDVKPLEDQKFLDEARRCSAVLSEDGGGQRKSQSVHPDKKEKSPSRIRSQIMAVPFISQVARQVPDTGQVVGQLAGQVPTSASSGQVLAKIPNTSLVIPSVQGLVMGQGQPTNQSPIRGHILPAHQVLVKGQVRPRGRVFIRDQIRPRGQIPVKSAGSVRVTSHILGQVSGQVKPATYVPGLRQIPASTEGQVKTLGLVSGQVVARELIVVPGSQPKVRTSAGGVRMQFPVCTSGASHSGAVQVTASSQNSGPVAGNQPTLYSSSKSVGYLDEYVRFMQTGNKRQAQHKIFEQLDTDENNSNLTQYLQQAASNGSNSRQSGTFKVEVVDKKLTADFGSLIARNTCASGQDSTVKAVGYSPTFSPIGSIQKSALFAEHVGSDSAVEIKHHMVKAEKIEHEETECEKVKNKETKSGKIETEKVEAKMMEEEDKKTEIKIIKTETSSAFVTNTDASMTTIPAFVSGVSCEEFSWAKSTMTGSASASDSLEVQSHKKLMNAIGGLLELKRNQGGVGTSPGTQDVSSYSVEETMAALQKFTAVSVTPISSLQKLKLSNNVQLDTGQTCTQSSDTSVPESPVIPSTSKDTAISGCTCSVYKVDIPCMGSKIDKSKSEPKPQTEFRIQINCKNEMYLHNTETGEIKPLNPVKSAKKWSRTNSRSTLVQAEPSNNASADSKISLGELPLHPVRVAGTHQNVIAKMTNIAVKADQSHQVTKTAPINIPLSGMSGSPSPIPKLSPSQSMSKPGNMTLTFPGKPVTSVSKLSQSELVVKSSEGNKSSMLINPPHIPKLVIARKPTATQSMPSKRQSAATVAARGKSNRRKPTYILHNAHGKMSRHTIELQEALESCVESMLTTDKDDNSVTLFGHGNTFDTVVKAESLPGLLEGAIQTYDVPNSKDMLQMAQPDNKHWPSLGREVTVETTAATPPLLEASPPLLEPAGSQQLTSTGEEGSSQPPQLTPESNTSIRTVSTAHITAKNRKCPGYLQDILQNSPPNLKLEKAFNSYWSRTAPFCSLCTAFSIGKGCGGGMPPDWKYSDPVEKPSTSSVWLSSSHFVTYKDLNKMAVSKRMTDGGDSSVLLSCRDCGVCVHSGCYGVTVLPSSPADRTDWTCDKCRAGMHQVYCCLCYVRGGALKRTTDARWAHILCALLLPGVAFKDSVCKEPISVLSVSKVNTEIECIFCGNRCGACIQCNYARCQNMFHPMCALLSGAQFHISPWSNNSTQISVSCKGHAHKHDKICSVHVGQLVWARHKNRRYYKGQITNISEIQFYMVLFSDGSFSDDLCPQDIKNFACVKDGPPPVGADVDVLWSDGRKYNGHFQGTNHQLMFRVDFEDGSHLVLKREAIYSLDEDMPKRVKGRLSMATEMKHEDHLAVSTDLSGQHRVNRGTNPRYSANQVVMTSTK